MIGPIESAVDTLNEELKKALLPRQHLDYYPTPAGDTVVLKGFLNCTLPVTRQSVQSIVLMLDSVSQGIAEIRSVNTTVH